MEQISQPIAVFNSSETKVNLLRAFAGESQARNRYTFAAEAAKKAKLHVIQEVFNFTADQEKAHAKVFYDFLAQGGTQNIAMDASYPVNGESDILALLRDAQHNEYEEFDNLYPHFGDVAKKEGFLEIAQHFYSIAEIEQTHGNRFGLFADLLQDGKLFSSDTETSWMCLNCGHIIKSTEAPMICPVCEHDQGYFIRLSMAPFTGKA